MVDCHHSGVNKSYSVFYNNRSNPWLFLKKYAFQGKIATVRSL